LNIYIYGSKSFQKDMKKILNDNKLKSKIAKFCTIITNDTVDKLKEEILADPTNIYLIDHNAIIVKNFFTTKIKILNVKEGIEEEFLRENGVGDMSVDNLDDIPQHILKRLESLGLIDDDDLDTPEEEFLDEDKDEQDAILKELEDMEQGLIEEVFEEKQDEIIVDKEEIAEDNSMGDLMEELTRLDDIDEVDLLDALSGVDGIDITSAENGGKTIEVESSQMDSVAALLEQLMNNKTLEISIKVKS